MEYSELLTMARKNLKIIEKDPLNTGLVCSTAELFSRAEYFDEAIFTIRTFLFNSDDSWMEYRLAIMYYRSGNFSDALKVIESLRKQGVVTEALRELSTQIKTGMEPSVLELESVINSANSKPQKIVRDHLGMTFISR